MDFNKSILRSPAGSSWRTWFEYGFYKFPYWDPPLGALGRHGLNMGFNKPRLRSPIQSPEVAAQWFLVVMVWIWILTSPYWDPPIRSCPSIQMDMVWIWILTSPYWDPPIWSCGAKLPGGHGFHVDSNKSMWRSTHLAFLVDMVSIWILTSPCGDPPIWPSSNVSWQTWFAHGL